MISIIIPTFNDTRHLPPLLIYLRRVPFMEYISEIIVCDGNSTDDTVSVAESFEVTVLKNIDGGKARQMNEGARIAKGEILYFLSADSLPPRDFACEIVNNFHEGIKSGSFRLQFDHHHWLLRLKSWFTRFNFNLFRFGGQSLFINRELFQTIGGFREDLVLLQDFEIIRRITEAGRFVVIPRYITTSARKYLDQGIFKLEWAYFYIFALYRCGVSGQLLSKKYNELLG